MREWWLAPFSNSSLVYFVQLVCPTRASEQARMYAICASDGVPAVGASVASMGFAYPVEKCNPNAQGMEFAGAVPTTLPAPDGAPIAATLCAALPVHDGPTAAATGASSCAHAATVSVTAFADDASAPEVAATAPDAESTAASAASSGAA